MDLGVEYGVLTKNGAFYSFGDLRLGQGRENSKTFLEDNQELRDEIETEIRIQAGLPAVQSKKTGEPVAAH